MFARAPVAGAAKTRLIPLLGAHGAAQLQARLIETALAKARAVPDCAVTLWLAGEASALPASARGGTAIELQHGADLGERMAHAFARSLARSRRVLLIGTDCPALTRIDLLAAFAALEAHDVVLQPAEDGGYVLIGLRAPQPGLFDGIAWGGPTVLEGTRQRSAQLGLREATLPALPDLDTPQDYARAVTAGWL